MREEEKQPKFPVIFRKIPYKLTKFIHSLIELDPKKRCSNIKHKKGYLILNYEYEKYKEKQKTVSSNIAFDENLIKDLQILTKIIVYRSKIYFYG